MFGYIKDAGFIFFSGCRFSLEELIKFQKDCEEVAIFREKFT